MPFSIPLDQIGAFGVPAVYQRADDKAFHLSFVVRVCAPVPGAIEEPTQGGYLVGYSPVCTHMGCRLVRTSDDSNVVSHNVVYHPDTNGAEELNCGPCPCHGTTFDLLKNGLVVLGPATQNLPQLKLELNAEKTDVTANGWIENDRQQKDPREETWPL
jgi:Rieske Fe-S protein